jgi:hypothetical protein
MGWLSRMLGSERSPITPQAGADQQPELNTSAPRSTPSDLLSALARDNSQREEFLKQVVTERIWILATAPGSDSDAKTPQELLKDIEMQAERLNQEQYGKPFTYALKGSKVLPVFSTDAVASEFVGKLKLRKATGFQVLSLPPDFWAVNDFGLTRVIFNPLSDCETEFEVRELRYMKSVAAGKASPQ